MASFTKRTNCYIKIAQSISELSNCVSYKVGAVIVKDGRIISTGYNGTPSGLSNCDSVFPMYDKDKSREEHHKFSDKYEVHAEANALIFAAKYGHSTDGSVLYVTTQPCMQCSKLIANSGITAVYYLNPYDKAGVTLEEQKEFFLRCGITFMQVSITE